MAATPSSCAKCRLPAAPPDQPEVRAQVRRYACSREPQYISTSVCGRRLLRPLRVRQLLRVLSPCCVLRIAAAVAERVTHGCVDIWMCKSIALKLKLSARCVPPRGAAQHQPRGCAAHSSSSVRTYQADNQADNQAVTSVRTTRLVLRYYQADSQAGSSADNPAGSLLPAQGG